MADRDRTQRIVDRLRRAGGQLGGVAGMVEEGRAAPDILTQTGATIAAIRAVEGMVVEDYLRERLDAAADASRADRDAILAELRSLMAGLG